MALHRATAVVAVRALLLIGGLTIWEAASQTKRTKLIFSSPSDIAAELWAWLWDGTLLHHAAITASEALLGFLLGSAVGVVAGILLGRSRFLADVLNPFITALNSLPKVALAPLFVLWFGIDLQMKVLLTATIVFFLVFFNTFIGVREVSKEQVLILRLMGAKERHVLTKVVIPSAFVWVVAGLSLSVPYCLIGAIVGELVASNRGLGYLIADAAGQFNTAGVFAALIAILVLAFLMTSGVKLFERYAAPWRARASRRESTT